MKRQTIKEIVDEATDGYQWNARRKRSHINLREIAVKLLKAERARVRRLVRKLRDTEVERQFTECPRCYRQACDDILNALKEGR